MILPMYIFGQPVLRKTAEEIDFNAYPNLKELITNMFETLERSEGVGLAAPQVGLPIQLFIIDLDVISDDEPQYKGYRRAFINPEIIEESEETTTMSEGCLSIPGINESVKRPSKVLVNYLDENGEEQERWLEGFEARVFQHEYDHLEGKMFVDRLSPFRKQMIKSKLIAMTKGKFSAHYKCKPNRG
ncbi:MAG: peptide deformylase [Bacteroidaceae bacterium]|nr:peptide deformylase [Bacteroidaceae bacterium]